MTIDCRHVVTASVLACCALAAPALAQSSIEGIVQDTTDQVLAGASVVLTDIDSGRTWTTQVQHYGYFVLRDLPAGCYRLVVEFGGFEPHQSAVIVLPRGTPPFTRVTLQLRAIAERVTVQLSQRDIDGPLARTYTRGDLEGPLLMNGRTARSFECITPTVNCTEQTGTGGQFTAQGQRRDSNHLGIDGVPANLAVAPGFYRPLLNDALPGYGVEGSTKTLIPSDAIKEITVRIAGTTPEHRHSPGAQTRVVTQSGGDRASGSFWLDRRLDAISAADWFDNALGRPRRVTNLTNTGGSLGGPVWPGRIFQFTVLEQQHLSRPVQATITVPSQAARASAPPLLASVLKAFVEPNGPDLGNGLAERTDLFPVSSGLLVWSSRIDAYVSSRHRVFARFNHGRSEGDEVDPVSLQPRLSYSLRAATSTATLTLGLTSAHSPNTLHELRGNISAHDTSLNASHATNNARPLPLHRLLPHGVSPRDAVIGFSFWLKNGNGVLRSGRQGQGRVEQFYIGDSLTLLRGRHRIGVGIDMRQAVITTSPARYQWEYLLMGTIPDLIQQSGTVAVMMRIAEPMRVRHHAWSMFVQDMFQVLPRVSLTGGFRYEVKPAPTNLAVVQPSLVDHARLPELWALPAGTPLWATSWGDVAPLLGATIQLGTTPGRETTLRTSVGRVHDDLTTPGVVAFHGDQFVSSESMIHRGFPATIESFVPSRPVLPQEQPREHMAIDDSIRRPRTTEVQISLTQMLGAVQRVSAAYVHAAGRDLVYSSAYFIQSPRYTVQPQSVQAYTNDGRSDYDALILDWRASSSPLAAEVVYTWSRALDNGSAEGSRYGSTHAPPIFVEPESYWGPADYNRPHVLYATASFRPGGFGKGKVLRALSADWQLDIVGRASSGAPVTIMVGMASSFEFGRDPLRPDLVDGVSLWIADPSVPGGQRLNPAALRRSLPGHQGTLARNAIRSTPLRQVDLAITRTFHMTVGVRAQLRVEVFNVFNLVNFAPPEANMASSRFGQANMSYARGLGSGTLTGGGPDPAKQIGGPRSIYASLRMQF